jgi:hypothetical protein
VGKRITPTPEQLQEIQTALDDAWDKYQETVFEIARKACEQFVQPQCEKRGWKFFAGMGTWVVSGKRGTIYPEVLEKMRGLAPFVQLLQLDVIEIGELATIMPDVPLGNAG